MKGGHGKPSRLFGLRLGIVGGDRVFVGVEVRVTLVVTMTMNAT
jgi:hypothetical protein